MSIILTDENFEEEVLKSDQLVLVDFFAEWCVPCKPMALIVDQIAENYKAQIKVGKFNIDEGPRTASQYQIEVIPTLLFFKNGQVIDRTRGIMPYPVLEEKIKQYL
ncbi:thioredoxin [Candidatus Parcubacteria bacterium]|nr:thioredoxin [Candidatus Parcubacteria bacterium]